MRENRVSGTRGQIEGEGRRLLGGASGASACVRLFLPHPAAFRIFNPRELTTAHPRDSLIIPAAGHGAKDARRRTEIRGYLTLLVQTVAQQHAWA